MKHQHRGDCPSACKGCHLKCRLLQRANNRLQKALNEAHVHKQQVLAVSEHEQQRLRQDLHDTIQPQLYGIVSLCDALICSMHSKHCVRCRRRLSEIRDLTSDAMDSSRTLAHGLRPVPPGPDGLRDALSQFAQSVENLFGIECDYRYSAGSSPLDRLAATHLYRVVQEAVHNAIRHGRAKRISICVETITRGLKLVVRDNGQGMPKTTPSSGMGLETMRNRVQALAGTIEWKRLVPHGTSIVCKVPRTN